MNAEAEPRAVIDLLPCPFCGGTPDIMRQGNNYTKRRRIVIRCPKCRIERADAAIKHGMDWLEKIAVKNWNQRAS